MSQLSPIMRQAKPFNISLNKLVAYPQKTSSVVYAVPETSTPNAIQQLQRNIESMYPEYNDLVLKNESGFPPQLCLAQFTKESVNEQLAKLQSTWKPIEFTVKELHLISRNGDVPFEVRASIQLGNEAPTKDYPENPVTFRNRTRPPSSAFKLFVSNLSWNVDSVGLADLFKEYRPKKAYIIMDKIRDRSRGYGFVEFETDADRQSALQALQGKDIDGRQILVKLAVEQRKDVEGGSAPPPPQL